MFHVVIESLIRIGHSWPERLTLQWVKIEETRKHHSPIFFSSIIALKEIFSSPITHEYTGPYTSSD